MSEPDEALMWARQWRSDNLQALGLPSLAQRVADGETDATLESFAQGYRAGQAASAERIKALEEAVRSGLSAVSESYRQAVAEVQGYDRVAERHDQFVVAWKAKARNLLKGADQ
jgi:predicted amidohydrolase